MRAYAVRLLRLRRIEFSVHTGQKGSDLQVAASMAAGMCASLGIAGKSKLLYLGDVGRTDELLSYPEVRAAANCELAKAEKAVRALLSERKGALRQIASRLLKDKRLDGSTAAAIIRKTIASKNVEKLTDRSGNQPTNYPRRDTRKGP